MEVILIVLIVAILILLRVILNFNLKQAKELRNNEKLDSIISRFPENKKVCEEILGILDNKEVRVKDSIDEKSETSFYFVLTNEIKIANIQDSYTRIQTIAHECIHSIQSKKMLLFQFIFSNIYLLYFLTTIVLTITKTYTNTSLQISILILLGFTQYMIKSILETEAILKSKELGKKYIEHTKLCNGKEIEDIMIQYDIINEMGVKAVNYSLFTSVCIKLIIYLLVVIIF